MKGLYFPFFSLPLYFDLCSQYQEKEGKKTETKEKPQKKESEKEEKNRKEQRGIKSKC